MSIRRRLERVKEEPLVDHRIPHPYREVVAELRQLRKVLLDILERLKKPAPAIRIPGVPPPPSPADYIDVVAHGLRKHGALMLAKDYHVETIDLSSARDPPEEFPKLSGIALTVFKNSGTFDLYLNEKDDYHKLTFDSLTYPQTFLIDWFDIKTVYIGNTAQSGQSATLIAWKPIEAPKPIAPERPRLIITPADRDKFHKMGDVNRDGVIDEIDLNLLKEAFGSTPGAPNWNPECDLNGDGKVDVLDVAIASKNYGLTIERWKARR